MKRPIALALTTLPLLSACTTSSPAQRRAELDAIDARYETASAALTDEYHTRLTDAPRNEKKAVNDWYAREQTRLLQERLDDTNETFDRWRGN